jgi:hypothetical protein
LNEYRNRVFDGNRRISPIFVVLLTFGIVFLAGFPPVGMILIFAAITVQRRFRAGHKRAHQRALAERRARAEGERQRAYLSFLA